ncbi:MAG: GNVR domain-containing protein [Pseudomonadota bacterium]|nr:GNVR domain-containing protein [Pseudomonadota bacterium]
MNKFGVVTVDQPALPAVKPAKPKKALVLAVAGILGLMLGVFIAPIRRAVKNRQESI